MIRNYIIIAWRNLIKNRLFSFITIFGLALSMSVGMMVMIRVMDSFSYDTFQPNKDKTFRITTQITIPDNETWDLASTPLPLQTTLLEESMIKSSVSLYKGIQKTVTDGVKDLDLNGCFTQPSLFDVFGFRLLHGNEASALESPFSIVITENFSQKFFGETNPVGKSLTVGNFGEFQITGVLAIPDGKSHIDFDAYVSYSTVEKLEALKILPAKSQTWDSFEFAYTYVVLTQQADEKSLSAMLARVSDDLNKTSNSAKVKLLSQKFSSITPSWGTLNNDIARDATWGKILIEISVALVVLLAACFNYTNLSIARALTRMREVGIRKIAGAKRAQIFFQYITESVVVSLIALVLAGGILSLILEYKPFNDSYELIPQVQISGLMLLYFVAYALLAGLLGGVVPSAIFSSFNIIKMLRNATAERFMSRITLQKALLIFQFSISLIMLIFLTAFYRQFNFMETVDKGYRTENIISVAVNAREVQTLRNELAHRPVVTGTGAISTLFGKFATGRISVDARQDSPQPIMTNYYFCDADAIVLSGLKLVAGENFPDHDELLERTVIINQKAVEAFGLTDAHQAVGQTLTLGDTLQVQISGVVENFYNAGVGRPISPLILRHRPVYNHLLIAVTTVSEKTVIAELQQVWNKLYPGRTFSYAWLDLEHQEQYNQKATLSLLGFLAFMTIVIAALGLLGLVVYTVETRRKEISIRKVIGAGVHQLVYLLSKGFVNILVIAGLISLPIGYILNTLFLINFVNRVHPAHISLVLAFVFLLAVGLIMIVSQTFRVASENPAKNLRRD